MLTENNTIIILQDKLILKETVDVVFNNLENELLDKKKLIISMEKVVFISVYFLEKLEKIVEKARSLNMEIKIINVNPEIYKVFQVGRLKNILNICF